MTQEVRNPEIEITLKKKKYKVGMPNIGQYLRIEGLKQVLTDGRYSIMAYGGLHSTAKALDIVDSIAYFTVLVGKDFLKAFKVKDSESILQLSMDDAEVLVEAYSKEYAPFYNKHAIRKDRPTNDDDEKEKETSE